MNREVESLLKKHSEIVIRTEYDIAFRDKIESMLMKIGGDKIYGDMKVLQKQRQDKLKAQLEVDEYLVAIQANMKASKKKDVVGAKYIDYNV